MTIGRRRRPDEPRRFDQDRQHQGPERRPELKGVGGGVRMPSSRSATAFDVLAEAGATAVIQPAARCATRKSSRRPTSTASPWCSPAPATSAIDNAPADMIRDFVRRPAGRATVCGAMASRHGRRL